LGDAAAHAAGDQRSGAADVDRFLIEQIIAGDRSALRDPIAPRAGTSARSCARRWLAGPNSGADVASAATHATRFAQQLCRST
jgi:hypothetical protein